MNSSLNKRHITFGFLNKKNNKITAAIDTKWGWGVEISPFGCSSCFCCCFCHDVMVIQYRSMEFASTHISMFLHCNRTCEIFLHLNSVGLKSFRFGPEIAYVASCVLDVLKGVRNKTLVGGAKKGRYYA